MVLRVHFTIMCHFWNACQNFWKARYLSYADKLFWFMAKVLGFAISKTTASNEDFLKSWWRSKCSNSYFPPLVVLIYLCVVDGAASAAVVERRCDWLTQTLLHCHWLAWEPGSKSETYSSGGKFKFEDCRIHEDLRKSSFEALHL